jgi:Arc/MetJ-type ribon-helix-helix transcriptional regulator
MCPRWVVYLYVMRDPVVTARVPRDLFGRLNATVESEGLSRSDLIRAAIERFLADARPRPGDIPRAARGQGQRLGSGATMKTTRENKENEDH